MRDDFSSTTRDLIAKRSGYICAYPGCKRMTVAGSEDRKSGLTMIGVAAHITAASDKGPRYDSIMNRDERMSEANGIWTCQNHGKFIDDNPSRCSVVELRRWKALHEKWVLDRVRGGMHVFNRGINRLIFNNLGKFKAETAISFSRNNIIVGGNESGKTSICQTLSAFSGGEGWRKFDQRFDFSKRAAERTYIELKQQTDEITTDIKLSPQAESSPGEEQENSWQRVHIEVNGCPAPDWPKSLCRVLHFDEQLSNACRSDQDDAFANALRYLANILGTDEDLIWDSLREEIFATSFFGSRFRRVGYRKIEVLVPDGRKFFLPHWCLSESEQKIAFLDIALKLVPSASRSESWIYIFDTGFFQSLDLSRKIYLFKKIMELEYNNVQTLFCLHSVEDAEVLKDVQLDRWVNAQCFDGITLHSFI